jgi:hypothetical protein
LGSRAGEGSLVRIKAASKNIARTYDCRAFDHTLTKHTLHKSDKLGASCEAYLAKFPDMTHLNLSYSGFKARAETYPVFFCLHFGCDNCGVYFTVVWVLW